MAPFILKKIGVFSLQIFSLIFLAASIDNAEAAEVDSFTNRHNLSDSRIMLNRVVNLWLEEAVESANRKTLFQNKDELGVDYCNQERLYDALQEKFTGFIIGKLEAKVTEYSMIDTIHVAVENSIYRDFDFMDSPSVSLTGHLAALLCIGDICLGADKFGHFFTQGLTYYKMYSVLDQSSALQFGDLSERTFYGEYSTGIFSYADLAANLNGLRFWNEILALKPDPIAFDVIPAPYVRCVDKKWLLSHTFDWQDYVDPIWDEALNCNAYKNEKLLTKVRQQILHTTNGQRCPLFDLDREPLQRKYGNLLDYIYNPHGNKILQEPLGPKLELFWSTIMKHLKMMRLKGREIE